MHRCRERHVPVKTLNKVHQPQCRPTDRIRQRSGLSNAKPAADQAALCTPHLKHDAQHRVSSNGRPQGPQVRRVRCCPRACSKRRGAGHGRGHAGRWYLPSYEAGDGVV